MRHISVPISCDQGLNLDNQINFLKEVNPDRVFITVAGRYQLSRGKMRDELIGNIEKYLTRINAEGYETGVWLSTLGYGAKIRSYNKKITEGFTRKKSILGHTHDDAFCPLNNNFTLAICELIEDIAKTGAKMIMLDDELVLSALPMLSCFCDLHMEEFTKLIGEKIEFDELPEKIFTGSRNKYRDAWYKMTGDTLRNFCKKMRETVDSVDSSIQLGFCAGYTSWDTEGVDAIELSHILAGNTHPFLRLTGAPYWYSENRFGKQYLQSISELTRQQFKWCENEDIEIFTEVDSYPRFRQYAPASHVELYDLMTIASDNADTLRYLSCYYTPAEYDRGYINAYLKNEKLREDYSNLFKDKKAVGIRIYEEMHTILNADLPDTFTGCEKITENWLWQSSQIPISHAIPTCYEGGICSMAFGENAKYLPRDAFKSGLILDIKAAEILQSKGIDTGLISKELNTEAVYEYFPEYGENILPCAQTSSYNIKIKDSAKALSYFICDNSKSPSAYLYENSNGQRFLVYAFSINELAPMSGLIISHYRGRQLNDAIEYLGGKTMPVICNDIPMLYCICKQNDKALAAAYFNCHDDEAENVKIKLSFEPKNIRFINCNGKIYRDEIIIDYIAPYKTVAFEAEF